jgi:predicted Zn-dependent protease
MGTTRVAMGLLVVGLLLGANLGVASAHRAAHDWEKWNWERTTIYVQVLGSHRTQARAAINDWHANTKLNLIQSDEHRDITMWGANFGDTGWAGLASVESSNWSWRCWGWCKLAHVHARYNSYYRGTDSWYAQKVHCHELGHALGQDHDSSGGCMVQGYRRPEGFTNLTSSHNRSDINAKY